MNPTYFDVMTLLEANSFGVDGVSLFGGEWGSPSQQILVMEGVGFPSPLTGLYEQPGVQILVRGEKGEADIDVYLRAKPISDFMLAQPEDLDINGTCYKGFEEGSNLAPLGKDSNERFTYSQNFYTWRNR